MDKQTNDFEQLPTTILGTAAEKAVRKHLKSVGYKSILWTVPGEGSCEVDGIALSGDSQNNLIEVKAKTKYPYNGELFYSIHKSDLIKYLALEIRMNMELLVVIMDHEAREMNIITAKKIKATGKEHFSRKDGKTLVYFKDYKKRADLDVNTVTELRNLSIKSKEYNHLNNLAE